MKCYRIICEDSFGAIMKNVLDDIVFIEKKSAEEYLMMYGFLFDDQTNIWKHPIYCKDSYYIKECDLIGHNEHFVIKMDKE